MSFDLVFFGGTGDLTWRKLMPALFQAFRHGKLPPGAEYRVLVDPGTQAARAVDEALMGVSELPR